MNRANLFRTLAVSGLAVLSAVPQTAAEVQRLTLTEAVNIATNHNRSLKIARLKVVENEQKKAGQHSAYFPSITNQTNVLHVTDLRNVVIPAGALGTAAGSLNPAQK